MARRRLKKLLAPNASEPGARRLCELPRGRRRNPSTCRGVPIGRRGRRTWIKGWIA